MSEFIYLGEDLGMGANKIWGAEGGTQFYSQAAYVSGGRIQGNVEGLRRQKRPMEVRGDFGHFYVGANAHAFGRPMESLDFDRLTGTPEMRALWYGALTSHQNEFGTFERPLRLMVGLPLQMMNDERALDYQRLVKGWMEGHHEWVADGEPYMVDVEQVRLAPQAVGALFDYAADLGGNLIPERRDALLNEVGVISIGFNTTELMVVDQQNYSERFTAGKTVGVRRLLDIIDPTGRYSKGELDMKLRSRKLEGMKQGLPTWFVEVNGFIEQTWEKSYERFEKILVVGGGAVLLEGELTKKFRGLAHVASDPVTAIARGLYKMNLLGSR